MLRPVLAGWPSHSCNPQKHLGPGWQAAVQEPGFILSEDTFRRHTGGPRRRPGSRTTAMHSRPQRGEWLGARAGSQAMPAEELLQADPAKGHDTGHCFTGIIFHQLSYIGHVLFVGPHLLSEVTNPFLQIRGSLLIQNFTPPGLDPRASNIKLCHHFHSAALRPRLKYCPKNLLT